MTAEEQALEQVQEKLSNLLEAKIYFKAGDRNLIERCLYLQIADAILALPELAVLHPKQEAPANPYRKGERDAAGWDSAVEVLTEQGWRRTIQKEMKP